MDNIKVTGLQFYHCDDKGLCPTTSYICTTQDAKCDMTLVFNTIISAQDMKLKFYNTFEYPFQLDSLGVVIEFSMQYMCDTDVLNIQSVEIRGISECNMKFVNENMNTVMKNIFITTMEYHVMCQKNFT